MKALRAEMVDRSVRVTVPVRVDFADDRLLIKEFTANLSVGGLFLPTEHLVEIGTEGELTFRISQWDSPFTIRARVVRSVPPDEGSAQQAGLGIQFLDVSQAHQKKLERLVEGIQDGSVVQAIRRSIREGERNLLDEIRRRPVDQKLMLALQAAGEEIDALIRDGHASVIERLLENPRLNIRHVRLVSRDQRLPTQTMMALRRQDRWFADEEVRFNYCSHRSSPLPDVLRCLQQLSANRLQQMATNGSLRPQVRTKARELLGTRQRRG
jgi:uncharacterized protein (TIGR02266 family)